MYVKSSIGFLRAAETIVSLVHLAIIPYLFDENCNNTHPGLSESETAGNFLVVLPISSRYHWRPGEAPRKGSRGGTGRAVVRISAENLTSCGQAAIFQICPGILTHSCPSAH